MPNAYVNKMTKRKPASHPAGVSPGVSMPGESVTGWPTPGPYWKSSFNRKTKMPVVKTRVKKAGLD